MTPITGIPLYDDNCPPIREMEVCWVCRDPANPLSSVFTPPPDIVRVPLCVTHYGEVTRRRHAVELSPDYASGLMPRPSLTDRIEKLRGDRPLPEDQDAVPLWLVACLIGAALLGFLAISIAQYV